MIDPDAALPAFLRASADDLDAWGARIAAGAQERREREAAERKRKAEAAEDARVARKAAQRERLAERARVLARYVVEAGGTTPAEAGEALRMTPRTLSRFQRAAIDEKWIVRAAGKPVRLLPGPVAP
ncbi:hypothetical protein [Paraconexibacter algicola]|uniref:hypothetical protein n=1 Tax=Paraconexibacter algicola TaxID=2133960 RepID=UPI0011B20282|nr:hypothetical protein [Paraconexibacter algicola]